MVVSFPKMSLSSWLPPNVNAVLKKIHEPNESIERAACLSSRNRFRMPGSHTWLRTVRVMAVTTPPQTSAQMLGLINAQMIVTVVPDDHAPQLAPHQSFQVQASALREKGCREETIEEG